MKACSACRVAKPLDDFGRRSATRDGYAYRCKKCHAAEQRDFARKHPDRAIDAKKRRWSQDWQAVLVKRARHSAKARGFDFSLTREDIARLFEKQCGKCYWLGIDFGFDPGAKHPRHPSIDRLDPSKGYAPDNVVLACLFANLGRNTLTQSRFVAFLHETGLGKMKD